MTATGPTVDLPIPGRALAIGAHPDDIEFGCGATLAKWSAHGTEVHLLVLTDGSKGTWDPNTDPARLATQRVAEQEAAARILGARAMHHGDFVDGELSNGRTERALVCSVIRRVRPHVVLAHDPWKRYRLHPDHRHAGLVALDGIVAARDPHFFPEQREEPHRPDVLLLFEAEVVDHYERVSEFVDTKVAALLAHRSQWRSTMGIDEDSPEAAAARDAFAARIRSEAEASGEHAGGGLAEGFKRIDDI
jgi:LmbE family N-acetylglucosaminyl deacetylase